LQIDTEILNRYCTKSGFRAEVVEKVMRLISLLNGFQEHPHLTGRFALKGGTALNLFIFGIPRLSVDIDLNYIENVDRDTMLSERPKIEKAIEGICRRENLQIARVPTEHAGGKWRLRYETSNRLGGNLEVDIVYTLRIPLVPVSMRNSSEVAGNVATSIPVLDIHELAAGKFSALLTRSASRDIYDAHALLNSGMLNPAVLRPIFTAYAGMSRVDFRPVTVDKIAFGAEELRNQLLPVLRSSEVDRIDDLDAWAEKLCSTCRERLTMVLPFSDDEMEFLDSLNDHGEIKPELLTDDAELRTRISSHPMLNWKALNVRDYRA